MRKSRKREYELGHKYDFDPDDTPAQKKFTKRRARRRYRAMKRDTLRKEGVKHYGLDRESA